ncbi:hypothetical protein [Aequorivita sp. CIP111184]|uniref:hypothetical protein n=1 Tax=Aequorivita sp. CIP111184 TaxID=2211356 RepID=UPI000DBC13B0|nr:hypothetical protein [Aequorivita sp. CIP111184]SRX55517.1 hypothetical protein AEQU1_02539 [Aequorivita sp. CIP111184]
MEKKKEKKNWLEWLITIISGILVFFTLGFLIYQLIYEERTQPDIGIVLGEIVQKDDAYAVPIKATNKGTATAENVVVEIISENGENQEKAEITFSFLPGKSSADGWITFNKNPRVGSLKTHVVGYTTP